MALPIQIYKQLGCLIGNVQLIGMSLNRILTYYCLPTISNYRLGLTLKSIRTGVE